MTKDTQHDTVTTRVLFLAIDSSGNYLYNISLDHAVTRERICLCN